MKVTFQRQKQTNPLTFNNLLASFAVPADESYLKGVVRQGGSQGALQSTQVLNQLGNYKINVSVNNQVVDQGHILTVTSNLCVTNAISGSDNS